MRADGQSGTVGTMGQLLGVDLLLIKLHSHYQNYGHAEEPTGYVLIKNKSVFKSEYTFGWPDHAMH